MAAWIPLSFALSLVVGGIGTFVGGAGPLVILSGILFGSAFAAMASRAADKDLHPLAATVRKSGRF
jgi:hypothetical protein